VGAFEFVMESCSTFDIIGNYGGEQTMALLQHAGAASALVTRRLLLTTPCVTAVLRTGNRVTVFAAATLAWCFFLRR